MFLATVKFIHAADRRIDSPLRSLDAYDGALVGGRRKIESNDIEVIETCRTDQTAAHIFRGRSTHSASRLRA